MRYIKVKRMNQSKKTTKIILNWLIHSCKAIFHIWETKFTLIHLLMQFVCRKSSLTGFVAWGSFTISRFCSQMSLKQAEIWTIWLFWKNTFNLKCMKTRSRRRLLLFLILTVDIFWLDCRSQESTTSMKKVSNCQSAWWSIEKRR